MTIQEVADHLGPLGFIPEWRFGLDDQQWHNPETGVRLSVRLIDGRIQYRKLTTRPTFSEWQTDDCNYTSNLARALEEPCC